MGSWRNSALVVGGIDAPDCTTSEFCGVRSRWLSKHSSGAAVYLAEVHLHVLIRAVSTGRNRVPVRTTTRVRHAMLGLRRRQYSRSIFTARCT